VRVGVCLRRFCLRPPPHAAVVCQGDAITISREALPGAKVKIFEGLGHNPFWEEPEAVAKVINGFLDGQ
jgi:pimeloyl-ACP methyl ester carboxylesterase